MPIKSKIRTIKNYPIDGVMFRDITTLFKDPDGLREAINIFAERYKDMKIDKIAAIESRGFLIGAPLGSIIRKMKLVAH
jgi:adenine phosphoribosyltransferase